MYIYLKRLKIFKLFLRLLQYILSVSITTGRKTSVPLEYKKTKYAYILTLEVWMSLSAKSNHIKNCSPSRHLFIRSFYFYSTSSSPLLLRGAPDTAQILCRSFTKKRHRQLQVKDLPKVPMWRLKRDSNPQAFGWKATNLSMGHHAHF